MNDLTLSRRMRREAWNTILSQPGTARRLTLPAEPATLAEREAPNMRRLALMLLLTWTGIGLAVWGLVLAWS